MSALCNTLRNNNPALLNEKNLNACLLLSIYKIKQISIIAKQLSSHSLLDQAEFDNALKVVCQKLPELQPSSLVRLARLKSHLPDQNSKKYVFDDHPSVYIAEQDNKLAGAYGEVLPGYDSFRYENAKYAVKEVREQLFEGERAYTKRVMREAKHLNLLGRNAFFYFKQCEEYSIVLPWHYGWLIRVYTLNADNEKITALAASPLKQRAKCIVDLLTQLNMLHSSYRVHGDLFHMNIIIGKDFESALIIDVCDAYKVGSKYVDGVHSSHTLDSSWTYEEAKKIIAKNIMIFETMFMRSG